MNFIILISSILCNYAEFVFPYLFFGINSSISSSSCNNLAFSLCEFSIAKLFNLSCPCEFMRYVLSLLSIEKLRSAP